MTVPVPDIHSGLSAEDERRYLVRAYRQVVGYSVNLPEEKLAEVTFPSFFSCPYFLCYSYRFTSTSSPVEIDGWTLCVRAGLPY